MGKFLKEFSYGICPYSIMNGIFYVLLNKTSAGSYFNFFKGKREAQESIEQCAIREFQEETGVKVHIKDLEQFYYQKNIRKDVGIFLVNWAKYQHVPFHFQEKEIWSASWVPLKSIKTSKNQQNIIDNIELDFKPKKRQLQELYFPNLLMTEEDQERNCSE